VYGLTKAFPRHEVYGLSSQMQRAAVSIPANIAEGHTRYHGKEYLHHPSLAQASLAELETEAEIAKRLGYLTADASERVQLQTQLLGRQLNALRKSLSRSLDGQVSDPRHPTPDTRHPT